MAIYTYGYLMKTVKTEFASLEEAVLYYHDFKVATPASIKAAYKWIRGFVSNYVKANKVKSKDLQKARQAFKEIQEVYYDAVRDDHDSSVRHSGNHFKAVILAQFGTSDDIEKAKEILPTLWDHQIIAQLEDFIAGRPILIAKTGYENMDMEEL
jgi:hypothetical protein